MVSKKRPNLSLLKAIPDLILLVDREGCLLACLGGQDSAISWLPAQPVGHRLEGLLPAAAVAKLQEGILQVLDHGEGLNLELALEPAEEARWHEVRISRCDRQAALLLIRDISADHQRRLDLRTSEEKFRGLVANIPGAVYRCLVDEHYTMQFISDNIEVISGYPVSDFIGNEVRSYGSLIHPEDQHWLESARNHALFMHQPFSLEYRISHRNGSQRWVYEKGRAIYNAKGKPASMDGAIFDISERKQAEEDLRIAEENYREVFQKNLEESLKLEYLQKDLKAASQIQANILPHEKPLLPNHPQVDVAAIIIPAKEVGGDFFDAFPLDESTICLTVGDVSGKGMPAGLFMVRVVTLIRLMLTQPLPLGACIESVNRHLCSGNDDFMFATVFIALFDVSSGQLTYVNGGHNPPFLASERGAFEPLINSHKGVALGLNERASFVASECSLTPGDRLVIYTDGVSEAEDPDGGFFSVERTLEVLDGLDPELSAEASVEALNQAVFAFARSAPQSDDVTILGLRYAPRR
ncbi:SpoIIE family protein phosphatase [Cyanobium sp. ATX 6F1]|uniref:SpoIIE family protein phosphatase n=1 Tax=unclassified Cyanobium TaxID=2627006 RepID=UPI0020CDB1C9|nr:SpoIIE family protein phosphatase [Cyanobium sp. ATX 6F1]MCP9915984.1 SpoIIE family protein phosphatase [Cyanobium sp. ATX 6F1]